MDILNTLLEAFGPIIIGLITVPIFGYVKKVPIGIAKLAPWIQRLAVVALALVISWVGTYLGVLLPDDLALWTPETVDAGLSAVAAWAAHAGNKTIEQDPVA